MALRRRILLTLAMVGRRLELLLRGCRFATTHAALAHRGIAQIVAGFVPAAVAAHFILA